MEDTQIIDLFFSRDQQAIQQTEKKYGRLCYHIAWNILSSREDAEESVSDTYMKAWENIPPTKPTFFYAYLAKICRFLAMGKLDWNNAAKRKAEVVELSEEMENRQIFMRRYWYAESIAEIAQRFHLGESNVKTKLMRTRNALRSFLEKEGIRP